MGGRSDTRGVSEVLGAILVFSILIALLALFQVTIVPDQNAEIEFNHNERVQQDMGRLQEVISSAAATGNSQTVSVKTGLRYPTRLLLLNPGPVSGSLRTEEIGSRDIELSNIQATDTETRDFLDFGSPGESFATRNIVYDPSYNLYANAPETTYESTVLYNDFEDGATIKDKGNIISGNRISLVVIDGELSQSSVSSVSLTPDALSATARTVTVTDGDAGSNIEITVPTKLDAPTWENEVLDDEMTGAGGNVIAVNSAGSDAVEIVLDGSVTYELRMAKIGVGSGTTEEDAHYMTDIKGEDTSVQVNGRQEIVLEVRDRFNNPVTNTTVNLSVDGDGELKTQTQGPDDDLDDVKADENGQVKVTYLAPSSISTTPEDIDIKASIIGDPSATSFDADTKENVSLDVRVLDPSLTAGGGAPLLNPPAGIVLNGSVVTGTACPGTPSRDCEVDVTFDNTDSNEQTLDEVRFVFYSDDSQGHSPGTTNPTVEFHNPSGPTLELGGQFDDSIDITISGSSSRTITLRFFDANGDPREVDSGEFFVLSFIIDGERQTYFIAPNDP